MKTLCRLFSALMLKLLVITYENAYSPVPVYYLARRVAASAALYSADTETRVP